ncbi:MAG: oligoribonuclease [Actinomycetota bacterium]|nr:oligoribonuclease [Actinomycetota bacterium]
MLAWMDLEMTGLDPARNVIVEIATLVTDDDLNIMAIGPDVVCQASAEQLDAMEDVVRSMHSRSGLLDAVVASKTSVQEACEMTLAFLRQHIPKPRTVPLCGNSIATDRSFLVAHMPEVDAWLHYRSVDVSSVKELCRRWYPEALSAAPRKATGHRAMDDIRESVAELAYYRSAIFRDPAGTRPTGSGPR